MDSSFTDSEKRHILAEMIKASQIDITVVVGFIKSNDILPDWMEMQYPLGRTPNQCRQAAEGMGIATPQIPQHLQPPGPLLQHHLYHQLQQQATQPQTQLLQQAQQAQQAQQTQQAQHAQQEQQAQQSQHLMQPQPQCPTTKRKSLNEPNEPMPKRLAIAPAESQPMAYARGINIQPRPSPNGYAAPAPAASAATPSPPRNPRKRGRPSKADREAHARASGSIGIPHARLAPAPMPAASAVSPILPPTEPALKTPLIAHEVSPREPVAARAKKKGRPLSAQKSRLASDEAEEEYKSHPPVLDPTHSLRDLSSSAPPEDSAPTAFKAEEPPSSVLLHGNAASGDIPSGERQVSRSRVAVSDLIKTGLQSPKTAKA